MSVPSELNKKTHLGNDETVLWPYPFRVFEANNLRVILTDPDGIEQPDLDKSLYSVDGENNPEGGNVTYPLSGAPLATGWKITIVRGIDYILEADISNQDDFFPKTHQDIYDRLMMLIQQVYMLVNLKLGVSITSNVNPDEVVAQVLQAAVDAVTAAVASANSAGESLTAQQAAEVARDAALAAASSITLPEVSGLAGTEMLRLKGDKTGYEARTVGQVLADIKAVGSETAALLQAVYGDEAQTHTGIDLSALTVNRNHIEWTLTEDSQFSDVTLPYDGTYIFHVYPAGFGLVLAASYKTDGSLADLDSEAGEIRIVIEQYNSRKAIVSLQNLEA